MSTENSDQPIGKDLWGNDVYRTARGRGRPPFEWTEKNSHIVSMLLAMGWANERIAACVIDQRTGKSISVPTLKRYFRTELKVRDQARDLFFAKQLSAAMEQAFDGGNVGAQRLLDQLTEKNDRALAEARLTTKPENKPAPAKLGKKESQKAAAAEAVAGDQNGLWGDDLKPGYTN